MKCAACFFALVCATAYAQPTAANRAIVNPPSPPPVNNFFDKMLHPLEAKPYQPRTQRWRLKEYLARTVGPYTLFLEAASAAVTTGANSPHEWGQTGRGYLERFGNNFGTLAVHNMISYPLSVAFREDNRYVASGSNRTLSRILHAAVSPFEARRYDGTVTFSYSNVVGVIGASAMSRAWAPESWQGPTNIGRSIAFTFAGEAAFNAFREFLPDLLHHR